MLLLSRDFGLEININLEEILRFICFLCKRHCWELNRSFDPIASVSVGELMSRNTWIV